MQLTCEELIVGRRANDTTRKSTLCGDRRGRGAKTRRFLRFCLGSRDPLRGSAWPRCKNPFGFLRFLKFPRDPLRGSAWSRCKNSFFFEIFNMDPLRHLQGTHRMRPGPPGFACILKQAEDRCSAR